MLGAIQYKRTEKLNEKTDIILKNVATNIQSEINLAFKSSNGYEREFELPDEIMGKEYNASVIDGAVYVRTLDEKHAIVLSTHKISGELNIGNNLIKKQNNTIYINNE